LQENPHEVAEINKPIYFGYSSALNAKLNMRRPINAANSNQMYSLTEKYVKLTDLNMKTKLYDMTATLVEASAKAK